jgi:hypothetical protein
MGYGKIRPNRGIGDIELLHILGGHLKPGTVAYSTLEKALKSLSTTYNEAEKQGLNPLKIRKRYNFLVGLLEKIDGEDVKNLIKKYPLDGGLEQE